MATYYQILDVDNNATLEQIRRAFRKKAKECHPDISNDSDSKERFQKLNEAHQVLTDANKRRLYDIRLKNGIVIRKVYYRPATTNPQNAGQRRWVKYNKRKPEPETPLEKIFDKILFYLLLLIGLYGVIYGLYRIFISPPENPEIKPVNGLIGGLVFTLLLVFLYKSLQMGVKSKTPK